MARKEIDLGLSEKVNEEAVKTLILDFMEALAEELGSD